MGTFPTNCTRTLLCKMRLDSSACKKQSRPNDSSRIAFFPRVVEDKFWADGHPLRLLMYTLVASILFSWTWDDVNSSQNALVFFRGRPFSALGCSAASRRQQWRYHARESSWSQEYSYHPREAACLQMEPTYWYTQAHIDVWMSKRIITLTLALSLNLKYTSDPGCMLHGSLRNYSETEKQKNAKWRKKENGWWNGKE